jgi:hypothetical protein
MLRLNWPCHLPGLLMLLLLCGRWVFRLGWCCWRTCLLLLLLLLLLSVLLAI